MATKVTEFLNESGGNNFTENAPRPPVPGEENERQSNHSSGSQKSHISNKSIASNKSSSNRDNGQSPAATPRRSTLHIDRCSTSMAGLSCDDDVDAPLGFEPEGSAANSPPFNEDTSTPSYCKWNICLDNLLEDLTGIDLFKEFLEQDVGTTRPLEFWFACEGLKKLSSDDAGIPKLVKTIHRYYLRGESLKCIHQNTRLDIDEKISRKEYTNQNIYNTAQDEVKLYIQETTYPLFLRSDIYLHYAQNGGKSPKTSNSSSGSNSVHPISGPLPPLPEDSELSQEISMVNTSCNNNSYLSDSSIYNNTSACSNRSSKARRHHEMPGYGSYSRSRPLHPLDVSSFVPVSLQESELQSSSDALTDDTVSLTDSSISDMPTRDNRYWRKQIKQMKMRAELNRESTKDIRVFVPRTDRAPKDRNLAETDPPRFFALLKEKLDDVLNTREKDQRSREKLKEKLRTCESDGSDEKVLMNTSSRNNTTANSILQTVMQSSFVEEENAQSILEDHVSRVWSSSNQQTPIRSPGRTKSPERTRKGLPAFPRTHKKKDRDKFSHSFDGGVSDDKTIFRGTTETHRHVHHHHYYHHDSSHKVKGHPDIWNESCDRTRNSKRSKTKSSDTGSNIDSGISMAFERDSLPPKPNLTAANSDKVLQWMLDTDKKSSNSQPHQDSEKSSSRRHRQHTSASGPQPSHKQSLAKKSTSAGRSSSVDRVTPQPWSLGNGNQVLPSQPIIQDSSMPPIPNPDVTNSLEEARRRLEQEQQTRTAPVKSKSFAGTIPKADKNSAPSSLSTSQIQRVPATKTYPTNLDISNTSTSEKKSSKKPSSSSVPTTPNTSTSQDETVIGYYFCGEPIPYKHTVAGRNITLSLFKQVISKPGAFRYFFKKACPEFDSGVVYEEVSDDSAILPLYNGIVVAKVDKIDS